MTEQKDLKIKSGQVYTDTELIAKFMGAKIIYKEFAGSLQTLYHFKGQLYAKYEYEVDYKNDWNCLMPVVSKIAEYRMAYPKQTAYVCDCKIVVYQHILYREVLNFIRFLQREGVNF